jgi:8-oxo-dGTP pyrophosphatase MutT (NUDIX family)
MDIIDKLRHIFSQPLAGTDAQSLMAPSNRFPGHLTNDSSHARNCSVMILLYQREGEWMVVLMERPSYNGVHSGQVSLPGGKWEPEDKNAWDAAVRETLEEIGVKQPINKIGQLTSIFIPHSDSLVYPMVGYVAEIGEFVPDSFEVAELIEAPVSALYDVANISSFTFQMYDEVIEAPCYKINGHCIWGATAMILSEFLTMVKPYSHWFTAPSPYNAQTVQEYP